jgi:hypothetical protein
MQTRSEDTFLGLRYTQEVPRSFDLGPPERLFVKKAWFDSQPRRARIAKKQSDFRRIAKKQSDFRRIAKMRRTRTFKVNTRRF